MVPQKTIVLPSDPTQARALLLAKLQTNTVLFVVLGQGAGSQALVSEAARLAGDDDDPRAVLCAPRPADILDMVKALATASPELTQAIVAGTAAAFTTSADAQIRDVIASDETIDDVRVTQAYLRAES